MNVETEKGDSGPVELDRRIVALIREKRLKVPPYPQIAIQLSELIQSGKYTTDRLAALISKDQTLSAAVLRAANSPALRRNGQSLTSLPMAVSRIGSRGIVHLAISVALYDEVMHDGPLAQLRQQVWRLSLWSAAMARHLSPRWKLDSEEAFLCGLLHDFGKVVAITCLETILDDCAGTNRISPTRCRSVVEKYHLELGMVVATSWRLPPVIIQTIRDHHSSTPFQKDQVNLCKVVDLAVNYIEDHLVVTPEHLVAAGLVTEDAVEALSVLKQLSDSAETPTAGMVETPATKGPRAIEILAPIPQSGEITHADPTTLHFTMVATNQLGKGSLTRLQVSDVDTVQFIGLVTESVNHAGGYQHGIRPIALSPTSCHELRSALENSGVAS